MPANATSPRRGRDWTSRPRPDKCQVVQLDLFISLRTKPDRPSAQLEVAGHTLPIRYVRNNRAKRYILRLDKDGAIRLTLPRWGTQKEARQFAERSSSWLLRQLRKSIANPTSLSPLRDGSLIWYRGNEVPVSISEIDYGWRVQFGDQIIDLLSEQNDYRGVVEVHLRVLATHELIDRTLELARAHDLDVRRVSVRNQRTRWGSCSSRRTISLNWRLIQTPRFVSDYIVLHELMHLRHMNHSLRFWRSVAAACPHYREAEQWLKKHSELLR